MTALSSGGLGDIVYAIPIMRELKVDTVYVKNTKYLPQYGTIFSAIKPLLNENGFDCRPYPELPLYHYDPAMPVDFDIDTFRRQPRRAINHIMVSMRNQFALKFPHDWKSPWLTVTGDQHLQEDFIIKKPYSVIHLTERWRGDQRVQWKKVFHSITTPHKYFVGFQSEWLSFCANYCDVPWLPTDNIMDLARVIRDSESLYCNQSVSLALAQGMGKTYFLERKPGKTNTLLYTQNENLL